MFNGITIFIIPVNVLSSRMQVLNRNIEKYNGIVAKELDRKVSTVLLDDDVLKLNNFWKKRVYFSRAKLLKLSWLSECIKRGTFVDEEPFILALNLIEEPSLLNHAECSSEAADLIQNKELSVKPSVSCCDEWKTSCFKNEIIHQLETLRDSYKSMNESWRALAYDKAISSIKQCKEPITSKEMLSELPGIGKKIASKIWELYEEGKIEKVNEFASNEKIQVLKLFNSIWGVGPRTAEKWYLQGLRTIEDVQRNVTLTDQEYIGFKYREEILLKIPRPEVEEIAKTVTDAAYKINNNFICDICGSYRRGEEECGDVDILITHPDGKSYSNIVYQLVTVLKDSGFLTDSLTDINWNSSKYMGVCQLKSGSNLHRRIDIIAVPPAEYATALLYLTGSAEFVRGLYGKAKSMQMKLNQHGLWINVNRAPLHRYRYLPRPITGMHEFDYESMEATPDHFPDKLEIRPKLWVAWLYRQPSNEPRWIKRDIELLFGVKPKLLEMNIFKNMPYWNKRLWKIKHLIEVKPIVFPNGEPTEEDIPYMRLFPDGRCIVDKAMKLDTLEADELNEEKNELTAKYFNEKLRFKWNRFEDILEDAPWTDPKQSRF
ncbi:DNA polymerase lambda [Trichinella pseudospiralis]|uniref:DNA polymerase n=1 Tax=Trichinella pseudospiralis TaxID=6337 RepID=A0A0V0YEE1_TRIPS|nr:DNA polymerase lambda [Trichinella pseudospiralis]